MKLEIVVKDVREIVEVEKIGVEIVDKVLLKGLKLGLIEVWWSLLLVVVCVV